jgi:hypothetical protein
MAWRRGESGNPKGRITGSGGRDKLISDRLRAHLLRPFQGKDSKEEMTNADKIAEVLVEAAANGSLAHALAVMDRVEGKPTQRLDHGSEGGRPLKITGEFVHVHETREEFERASRIIDGDYQEAKDGDTSTAPALPAPAPEPEPEPPPVPTPPPPPVYKPVYHPPWQTERVGRMRSQGDRE